MKYLIVNKYAPIAGLISALLVYLMLGSCQSEPGDAPPMRPNILFAIADDASYPHMGAYGTQWIKTPAFDRVAREGLLFQRAYTPNAKCAPSRACILTGRNSWQLEEACNHWPYFPEKFKTFTEALPEAGYHVGYTAKGWAPGIATLNGAPRDLIGAKYNEYQLTPPGEHISGIDYARNFEAFLDDRQDNQPFFFWYGSTEPHRAYEYGIGIRKGDKKLEDIDAVPPFWPDNDSVRTDMLDYAFEIEYFDRHLQQMLNLLEDRGLLENTLVVVTADNGMPFPRVKGQIYEMDNHLPLAMMWPKGIEQPGRKIDDFVSFSDFAPTFLELAGIDLNSSGMQPISGSSLYPIFTSSQSGQVMSGRDHILLGKERHDVGRPGDVGYPVRGIIRDGYLYTENFEPERWPAGNPETGYLNCDGSPTKTVILNHRRQGIDTTWWDLSFAKRDPAELYDISTDPYCINNLIGVDALKTTVAAMRETMYSELEAQGDPRILGNGEIFDNYPDASSNAGFYERWQKGNPPRAGWVNASDFEPEEYVPLKN